MTDSKAAPNPTGGAAHRRGVMQPALNDAEDRRLLPAREPRLKQTRMQGGVGRAG